MAAAICWAALRGAIAEFEPVPGISRHFHSCVVAAEGWEGGSSDRTMFGPDGEVVEIKMPKVATSFGELQEFLYAEREAATVGAVAAPRAGRYLDHPVLRDVKLTGWVQVYLPQVDQGPGGGSLKRHRLGNIADGSGLVCISTGASSG